MRAASINLTCPEIARPPVWWTLSSDPRLRPGHRRSDVVQLFSCRSRVRALRMQIAQAPGFIIHTAARGQHWVSFRCPWRPTRGRREAPIRIGANERRKRADTS
ncbi:hypothetical protein MRX96_018553 [Rhipicephalus microplus]